MEYYEETEKWNYSVFFKELKTRGKERLKRIKFSSDVE